MKVKKIFKGMTAAAMAAILAASMVPMTAFATTVTTEAQSITFKTATASETSDGVKYKIYTVATAAVATGGTTYTYTMQAPFSSSTNYGTIDAISKVSSSDATAMKTMANELKECVTDNTTVKATVNAGESTTLEPGYYLVITTGTQMTSAPILLSVRSDMSEDSKTVSAKTSSVTFNKKITGVEENYGAVSTDGKTAETAIGKKIKYSLTSNIPLYASTVTELKTDYTITDNPSIGLTIDKTTIKVKVDGTEVTAGNSTYTLDTTSMTNGGFKVTFADAYVLDSENAGDSVEVTFVAKLNENAVVGTAGNPNSATLDYDNDYYEGNGDGDETSKTTVYTTKLVLTKSFSDSPSAYPVATFKLYKGNSNEGTLISTQSTTSDNNVLNFTGLAAGTYYLEETSTPDGYATADPVTITINANTDTTNEYNGTYTFTNATATTDKTYGTLKVTNTKGQTLPGTGGIGTVIFTAAGIGIVLLAGVMLVVYMKKRKSSEK